MVMAADMEDMEVVTVEMNKSSKSFACKVDHMEDLMVDHMAVSTLSWEDLVECNKFWNFN